jgi:iron complex outermembrane receptor protein
MVSTHRSLARAVRSVLGATSLMAGAAFPADEDPEVATRAVLDRVEVTGSRIKRTQLEGTMPVTTVTREDIERTGLQSIGDLVQELTSVGSAINTNFNNGGDGGTYVNIRNLGYGRTLVLVNGRRFVNGGSIAGNATGATDLNTIPLAIIDRVEVLLDGASAVYGSDAIAGVVNIITRKEFDGAQANAFIGTSEYGDGRQESYDFSLGNAGTRGSAMLSASYYKGGEIWAGDRDISMEPVFRTGNSIGSSTTPMGRFRIPDAGGTLGAAFTVFGGAGATRDIGNDATPTVGDFRRYVGATDAYNFAPDNYLATPFERWALYTQARYEITDNVSIAFDAMYNMRYSEQLLAPHPLVVGFQGSTTGGQRIGIDVTNPYNFFGQTLSPSTAAEADPTQLFLRAAQRRLTETGGRYFTQTVQTFSAAAGLEGTADVWNRAVDWNIGFVFGDNHGINVDTGQVHTGRVATALGPVSACVAPCVPLNLFGGVGSITPEMLNYIGVRLHSDLTSTLYDTVGNVSFESVELPAGPIGVAFGFESRRESMTWDPDALVVANETSSAFFAGTIGGYRVDELYLELAIPVLRDVSFAHELELSLASRYSDYSHFGTTTNSKLGLRWSPTDDLLVRGTVQEAFRSPGIDQLYWSRTTTLAGTGSLSGNELSGGDLCSVPTRNGGVGQLGSLDPTPGSAAAAQLLANCTGTPFSGDLLDAAGNPGSDGVNETYAPQISGTNLFVPAAGFVAANMYGQVDPFEVTFGGNPDLQPEISESWTAGVVYSPGYITGLSISLDWYSVEIQDAVVGFGSNIFRDQCYRGGIQTFCDYVTRLTSGEIDEAISTYINFAEFHAEGVDLNVVYRVGEIPLIPGEWRLSWDTHWVDKYEYCEIGGCVDMTQTNQGDTAIPAFKSNLDVEWLYGEWEASWRIRFIGRQYEACTSSSLGAATLSAFAGFQWCSNPDPTTATDPTSNPTNALGATTYHSIQVSYNISDWDTRVTVGIHNVGNKVPPTSFTAFANSFDASTYEVPGRVPYVRVSKTF